MKGLDKYSDEELFAIFDADIEKEIKSRGYEYGWHKQVKYAGVIYILVNPAFPNLVKIGYSDEVKNRLKSLNSNSGLPDPYHVYATYKVKKRLKDLKLHDLIDSLDSDLKHVNNREFYEMSPEKAYGILSAIAEINGDEDLLVLNPLNDDFFKTIDGKTTSSVSVEKKDPLTFALLNIPIGAELVYKDDVSVVVRTVNDKSSVEYHGNVYSMSGLVKHLKNGGSWQGGEYFMYEGKKLTDMRKELEQSEMSAGC